MSEPVSAEVQQQNYKEFLALLPLTLSLAGLPTSASGQYYTADAIEARSFTIRNAFKTARGLVREVIAQR
ncbi:MAG: hypothetical protein HZA46_04615 [Planctomycetales bacterium]|nr:hypothetical protein [Planctomycetales bacterium]